MKTLLLLLIAINLYATPSQLDVKCLAQNIYFEARSSNLADQAAVADVVLNRVESRKYPNTICKVVQQGRTYKGNPVRNKCQFSWYCDGKPDRMTDTDSAKSAYYVAYQMLHHNKFRGISESALMYHADYVKPYWAKSYQLVGTIGRHHFYRSH